MIQINRFTLAVLHFPLSIYFWRRGRLDYPWCQTPFHLLLGKNQETGLFVEEHLSKTSCTMITFAAQLNWQNIPLSAAIILSVGRNKTWSRTEWKKCSFVIRMPNKANEDQENQHP